MAPTELVEVTQADRDAAADLILHACASLDPVKVKVQAALTRTGDDDQSYEVQAFARHRLQSLPTARIGEIVKALEGAASQCRTIQAGLEESANVASVGQHVESGDLRDSARAVFQVETKLQAALSTLSPTPVSEGEKAE